jgi:hypothetical protein
MDDELKKIWEQVTTALIHIQSGTEEKQEEIVRTPGVPAESETKH